MNTFASVHAARAYLRGYCVERVIARLPSGGLVVVHPRTAARNRWQVIP